MTRIYLAAAALAAALPAAALVAQTAGKAEPRPPAFEALVNCREITDDVARLRCFDAAAAELEAAADRRDIAVVDRQQMRDTKRKLFGLNIPDLNPFSGGGGGKDAEEEDISSIESEVVSAIRHGNGRWSVTLKEGGTWSQTDDNPIALRPRAGQKVVIQKAAMGSYMMRVNNQPGVRAKRDI